MTEKYGYYATHGGFANYNNGFAGLKYRKTRKNEYIAPQGLAHFNTKLSENEAPPTEQYPDMVQHGERVNEIVIGKEPSNEEIRLLEKNSFNDFVGDAKSNVRMVIEPLKKPASGVSVPLRKDEGQMPVKFDG